MIARAGVRFLKYQDKKLTGLAMRAMKWTGRHERPIHPKHLYDDNRNLDLHALFREGMHFLDVGSGAGSDCLRALAAGAEYVYGVELNEASVALSHERLKAYAGRYEIFVEDLEKAKIPLHDNTVDLINFSNVLEHLHNRQGILAELARVMKPEGRMYISIPNSNTPWKKLQRKYGLDSRDDPDHKIEYSEASLEEELTQAGLTRRTELKPIVPSLPVNGLIALSAPLSPALYKALQNWKSGYASRHPRHTIGWHFLVSKN